MSERPTNGNVALSLSIVALSRTTLTLARFMISFIDSAVYLPLSGRLTDWTD